MKKEDQEANEALKTFDTKGEGAIELHKLKSIMTSLGEDTFQDVEFRQEIMKEIYTGSDGKMNYTGTFFFVLHILLIKSQNKICNLEL